LGITEIEVTVRPKVAILSTGDELIPPENSPEPGQVRDVNSYTISALVEETGAVSVPYGIVPDQFDTLLRTAHSAREEADVIVISAGSSVSVRDLTARVIEELGKPGVLVHGVALKPGKPTILGMCNGKAVIGLPGNPVSAFVTSRLFVLPLLEQLMGIPASPIPCLVEADLTHNIPSSPGREDYVPVRIERVDGSYRALPVFGKSNLIYTLIHSHGLVTIDSDSNGLESGERVDVQLF
jgi:molybdopterin molybdotransferase